jgi:hypothetical protein
VQKGSETNGEEADCVLERAKGSEVGTPEGKGGWKEQDSNEKVWMKE